MKPITRRSFVANSTRLIGASVVAGAARPHAWAAPASANETIRVGIIGLGNKGLGHLKQVSARKDARVVALCDADPARINRAKSELKGGTAPFTSTDARAIMSRSDVDVVMIATCNHWHALHAVWGCQAGKDVYVEKPMTHTVWEGRKLIEAAAKYNRIVQVGTQYRSEHGFTEGIQWLHAGHLGKIKHVHCLYLSPRGSIGRKLPWYPTDIDYDLFCGPAAVVPLERNKLHYDWHWTWNTGNGDLGNNGVHMLDGALQVMRKIAPPRRALGIGGRFVIDDSAETPNTQLAIYDYPDFPVVFEHRALPAKPGVNYMDSIDGKRGGLIAYCEGGRMTGMTGCIAYDRDGKEIKKFAGEGGSGHLANFLDAVRGRRKQDLAAPVEAGHASAAVCHYGNISYRLGKPAAPEAIARALEPFPAAATMCRAVQAHLGNHGIDVTKRRLTLGPWIDIDANDNIVKADSGGEPMLARARYMLHEAQRPPYAIPETV